MKLDGWTTSYFNSHPHEEDDVNQNTMPLYMIHFNSHPHEEDDDIKASNNMAKGNFNSHPHEEDDSNFKQK